MKAVFLLLAASALVFSARSRPRTPKLSSISDEQYSRFYSMALHLLAALSPCRQTVRQQDPQNALASPFARTIIRFFSKSNAPLLIDPPRRTPDHGSKYGEDQCKVHLMFPAAPKLSYRPRINFLWALIGRLGAQEVFNKQDDIVVAFINLSMRQAYEYDYPLHLCDFPLNTFVVKVLHYPDGYVSMDTLQLNLRCAGGRFLCYKRLSWKPRTAPAFAPYAELIRGLKAERRDMQGVPVYCADALLGDSTWPFIKFLHQPPLRYAYGNVLLAKARLIALEVPAWKFNMSLETLSTVLPDGEACIGGEVGFLSTVPMYHFGLARPYVLDRYDFIRALYMSPIEIPNAYQLSSLRWPVVDPLVWLVLLITLMTCAAVLMIKTETRDKIRIATAAVNALWGVTIDMQRRHGAVAFYTFWILVTWYLSTVYTTVLQSLTVVPELKPGEKTTLDLIEESYKIVTPYRILQGMKDLVSSSQIPDFRLECPECPNSSRILELEKKLVDTAVGIKSEKQAFEFDFPTNLGILYTSELLLTMKLVFAMNNWTVSMSSDSTFNAPIWISFYNLPNSDVVYEHYLQVQSTGLLKLWEEIVEKLRSFGSLAYVYTKERKTKERVLTSLYPNLETAQFMPPGMTDPVTAEIFCVIQYGLALATGVFVAELVMSTLSTRIFLTKRTKASVTEDNDVDPVPSPSPGDENQLVCELMHEPAVPNDDAPVQNEDRVSRNLLGEEDNETVAETDEPDCAQIENTSDEAKNSDK